MKIIREKYLRSIWLGCFIMVLLLSACHAPYRAYYMFYNTRHDSTNQNLVPWTDKNTCLFGYKNKVTGRWAVPGQFDYAADFYAGTNRAVVIKNHKFGLTDSAGRLYPDVIYDSILTHPLFDKSQHDKNHNYPYYFEFCKKGKFGLLDTTGHVYVPARNAQINWIYGRLMGIEDRLCDTAGTLLLKDAIVNYGNFSGGTELFYRNRKLDVYADLIEGAYPSAGYNQTLRDENRRKLRNNIHRQKKHKNIWLIGLVDSTGKVMLPPDFIKISPVSNLHAYIVTTYEDKMGVTTYHGDTVLKPEYFDIKENFKGHNNLLYIEKDHLINLYDYNTRTLIFEGRHCKPDDMIGNTIPVMTNHKYGLVHLNGQMITAPEYDDIKKDSKRNAYITKSNGKYGIIDTTGKTIIPCRYDSIAYKDKSVQYLVKDSGKYGLTDTTGKTMLPCTYTGITLLYTNIKNNELSGKYNNNVCVKFLSYCIVKDGDRFGLTDTLFKVILSPSFTYLKYTGLHADTAVFTAIKNGKLMQLKIKDASIKENILTGRGIHVVDDKILNAHNTLSDTFFSEDNITALADAGIVNNDINAAEYKKPVYLIDKNGSIIRSFTGYVINEQSMPFS